MVLHFVRFRPMSTTAVPVPPVLATLIGRLAAAVPGRARATFTELLIGAAVTRPEFAVVRKRAGIPAPYQRLTHPRRLACAYKPAGRRLNRRRGSAWGWRSGAS